MAQSEVELLLVILGFAMGVSTRLKFAFRLTIFMLQVIEWWIKTHPTGQKMALETNLDEEFYRLFGVEIKQHSHLFNGHQQETEQSTKLLRIGEAAKLLDVKVNTLRIWDKNGKLKPYATNGHGDRRYRKEDVERMIQSARVAK